MIRENELRIGNWCRRIDGINIEISAIGKEGLNICSSDRFPVYLKWDIFNPIILTHEILKKCKGLIYDKEQPYNNSKYAIRENNDETLFYIYCDNGMYYYLGLQILYLHQLQNLYFALTGQELKINL